MTTGPRFHKWYAWPCLALSTFPVFLLLKIHSTLPVVGWDFILWELVCWGTFYLLPLSTSKTSFLYRTTSLLPEGILNRISPCLTEQDLQDTQAFSLSLVKWEGTESVRGTWLWDVLAASLLVGLLLSFMLTASFCYSPGQPGCGLPSMVSICLLGICWLVWVPVCGLRSFYSYPFCLRNQSRYPSLIPIFCSSS